MTKVLYSHYSTLKCCFFKIWASLTKRSSIYRCLAAVTTYGFIVIFRPLDCSEPFHHLQSGLNVKMLYELILAQCLRGLTLQLFSKIFSKTGHWS